jgi:signal transduction histidine kinase/DNA-binding response OmpR family regulator
MSGTDPDPTPAASVPEQHAAILVVDDRPDKLLALEAVLEDLGQPIIRADSGREALRHVLQQDFAVILLDVNMPGMDGFETASLIRQRQNSRHTPIIFITAFDDEMYASRSYSLGAVDYIRTPVLPDVLRSKVAVFVDLFLKTNQIKRQAESLHRRASQMQTLAAASLAINSASSIETMLRTVTDTARDAIGAHQAVTLCVADWLTPGIPMTAPAQGVARTVIATGSFSSRHPDWQGRPLALDAMAAALVARGRTVARLTEAESALSPDWDVVRAADLPPIRGGVLTAPLTSRDGSALGVLYLSEPPHGTFTADDEAVLIHVAHMASIAIENTLYAQERQANRIKDEFLATLSHELRTPLNAIIGWVQLLQLEAIDDQVAHGLQVIDRNARAQNKLIEDLLDASRITAGKLQLQLQPVALGPLVQAVVDASGPAAAAKQIQLDVCLDENDPPVAIDADRIQQVVANILSNAIKFTPTGGTITVRLQRVVGHDGTQHLQLRVSDTGQGIDAKFLPFIFDRFRQADSSSTRRHGGLGLGLTIVRHIVEQHGGRVIAESDGPDRGTTLVVDLPVALTPRLTPSSSATIKDNGAAPPAAKPLADLRVLVVDDDPDACEMAAATLRRAGADVLTATSANAALALLDSFRPRVLVSDIAMPGQDGYALIRAVRSLLGDLPAIALTAYARDDDRELALTAGFDAHIGKPIDPNVLVSQIAELCATR